MGEHLKSVRLWSCKFTSVKCFIRLTVKFQRNWVKTGGRHKVGNERTLFYLFFPEMTLFEVPPTN